MDGVCDFLRTGVSLIKAFWNRDELDKADNCFSWQESVVVGNLQKLRTLEWRVSRSFDADGLLKVPIPP